MLKRNRLFFSAVSVREMKSSPVIKLNNGINLGEEEVYLFPPFQRGIACWFDH
jgi:hypothetical protein